jgi:hypothetical protein
VTDPVRAEKDEASTVIQLA